MSYDLEIWSVRPFEPAFMRRGKGAEHSARNDYTISGNGWQIVINSSDKILPEDIDTEISAAVPGIRYLTEVNLEGAATKQALKLLQSTSKEIAKRMHGVVLDPQSDRITTPSGVTRFIPAKKEKTFSVLNLSWWFLNDVMLKEKGRVSFLSLLQKLLPEALPKRYGEYEPPQYLFAKTGVKHLERFMGRHLDDVMAWYPNRPVTTVEVRCPKPLGPSDRGFRTNSLEIQVERSMLTQPGWAEHLRHFWREMTFLLQPIYGEVRSEGGYTRSGGTVWMTANSIQTKYPFTTRSFFWRGVPRRLGHAVVLGKKYQALWPSFMKKATREGGFAFASTAAWSEKTDLLKVVGPAPKAITLLPGEGLGRKQKYPRIWPFDSPFEN
jgi:hypothetical protein